LEKLLSKINNLPHELQSKKEKILNTRMSFIEISLQQVNNLDCIVSKVGGKPYIPTSEEYPLDRSSKPMEFLGQINFKDLPEFGDYPTIGLLQFFISLEDWGINYEEPLNSDIKVIYHKTMKEESQTEFKFLDKQRDERNSPIGKNEFKMNFSKPKNEVASSRDYRSYVKTGEDFKHYLEFDEFAEPRGEELEMAYWDTFSSFGHKIGGYADFAQQDPRFYKNQNYTELLFQFDSDSNADILWGDNGIANFFIQKEDLKNKNFSNILYNWDSH
jgi:uncharacterized protein YwqG